MVKEILNNCIAHSNYQLRGKINVEEFEDRLVFINEGNFIPETVEQALEEGYPMMYQIQREKCFPLPTYDLENPSRVKVTLFGKILDKNYTQLLKSNGDLDL